MMRAAVAIARKHARRYCSDVCGSNDRNRRAYERKTVAVVPPIKWAGGKRWALDRVRRVYRYHRRSRLVEPFAGAAAISLGLRPTAAHLNDANPLSIAFLRRLAEGLVIPETIANDRSKETYLANRDRLNDLIADGSVESDDAAALFYIIARSAFNGLWRTNRAGLMNTPWGGDGEPVERDLGPYQRVLKDWSFSTGDFEAVSLVDDDFLFVDPPYDGGFVGYAAGGFGLADQTRLVAWMTSHRGPIVAMNAATPRILSLYRDAGFTVKRIRAPRRVSADGDRTGTLEMIATRNTSAFDAYDSELEDVS